MKHLLFILSCISNLFLFCGNIHQLFKMEDVSVGMWVEHFKNTSNPVDYRHSLRFCQFGCVENYYTAHYQSPRQMICLWDKLLRQNKPECCNMRWLLRDVFWDIICLQACCKKPILQVHHRETLDFTLIGLQSFKPSENAEKGRGEKISLTVYSLQSVNLFSYV